MRSELLAALTAASILAGSSVSAAAQTASAVDRAPAATTSGSQLDDDDGGYTIWIIGAVVLGLLIWGIIELTDDDEDEPISP